jgi:hypothetical protein
MTPKLNTVKRIPIVSDKLLKDIFGELQILEAKHKRRQSLKLLKSILKKHNSSQKGGKKSVSFRLRKNKFFTI